MIINIKPLMRGEKEHLPFSFEIPLENLTEDISAGVGKVSGKISNFSGYMTLEGEVDMCFTAVCGRCTKETQHTLKSVFSRPVASTLTKEDDEYIMADDDGNVDVDDAVYEAVYSEMPVRFLCKESCKGLCPKCGADLNDSSCSCVEEKVDPRLAKLKDYLEQLREE